MIFTKTKISTDPTECTNEMIKSDNLLHQKTKILENKDLCIIHIDQGDYMLDNKKVYYLVFVYMLEDKKHE